MHGRLAWALLELSQNVFTENVLKVQLTRKDLVEFTNISVMNLGRILREFSEEKLIDLKKDYVKILNKDKLIVICRNDNFFIL